MPSHPTIIPAKRRVHRKAKPVPSPPAALAVVSVEVTSADGADMHVVLTFNTTTENPLDDVTGADPAKWTARYDGVPYYGAGGDMDRLTYNTVHLHLLGNTPEAGADVMNYSNAPSDISDSQGRQLAAFAGMPL